MQQRLIKTKGKLITINIYYCGLCGQKREVRTTPKSPCWCRVKFPCRYMYFRYQVADFFIYCWQRFKLLFIDEWYQK